MRMRKILRSKIFWGGAVAGTIAGPWALGKLRQVSGVGLSLPSVGSGNGS